MTGIEHLERFVDAGRRTGMLGDRRRHSIAFNRPRGWWVRAIDNHASGRFHQVSLGYTLGIDAKADISAARQ